MARNERIHKYLDAGSVFGQVSRGRAEEIVRELVNAGDIKANQAQEWVDSLLEHSRRTSEQVRREVSSQLRRIDPKSLEDIGQQVADLLKRSADAGRSATRDVTAQASKAAQTARTQASKTAQTARTQASKTAKTVRTQADKTASRARTAVKKVAPARPGKTGPAKKASAKKSGSGPVKTASTGKTATKATKSSMKAAS
jgi:polyhydroxyalkanoate synthesis regulator phasin